jgi:hypothetical protein
MSPLNSEQKGTPGNGDRSDQNIGRREDHVIQPQADPNQATLASQHNQAGMGGRPGGTFPLRKQPLRKQPLPRDQEEQETRQSRDDLPCRAGLNNTIDERQKLRIEGTPVAIEGKPPVAAQPGSGNVSVGSAVRIHIKAAIPGLDQGQQNTDKP